MLRSFITVFLFLFSEIALSAPVLGSNQADNEFPREVNHWMGKTVIQHKPLRVVALSTGQTDGLLTLGIVPVGTTRDDRGTNLPSYLIAAYPSLLSQHAAPVDLGGRQTPDIERIAALHPDLILVNKASLSAGIYERYQRIAPTVVTQGTGINWRKDFVLLADAVGLRDQAKQWLKQFNQHAQQFRDEPAKGTISFAQINAGRMRIMGTRSFVGDIAQEMGVTRPLRQQFNKTSQDISIEHLDYADGDWLFYGARGRSVDTMVSSPLWKTLSAVQNQHTIRVDYEPFYMNAGPTAAQNIVDTIRHSLLNIAGSDGK